LESLDFAMVNSLIEIFHTSTYPDSFLNTVFLTPPNHPLPYKNLPVTQSINYPGADTESSMVKYTYDNNKADISEKETGNDGSLVIKKYEYYEALSTVLQNN
jgi:hypothetical protein